jgi:hypothetical protein
MIRVLVALSPRMYRQAIALLVHRGRPDLVDVRLAPPEAAKAELASFRPHAPADKQYLGSSFSPSFHKGEGWITAGRTGGYGKKGNAEVYRVRVEDGGVVRSVNLTKSAIWDSAPDWGTHPPVG